MPDVAELAERFVDQIRIWDRAHRHGLGRASSASVPTNIGSGVDLT